MDNLKSQVNEPEKKKLHTSTSTSGFRRQKAWLLGGLGPVVRAEAGGGRGRGLALTLSSEWICRSSRMATWVWWLSCLAQKILVDMGGRRKGKDKVAKSL